MQTVTVVGAGNMGSGIAQKIATEGVPVFLLDVSLAQAEAGVARIRTVLTEAVARKIFSSDQAGAILRRITPTGDFAADADLVIEAVFEDLQVKRDVFARLSDACRPDTILATNTSSFLVDDFTSVVQNPQRVIGLHYFYHPAKNRLVEVIGHRGSDPAVLARAWRFQEAIGKTPVKSADAPGFIVNRFFVPFVNEAVRLHEEGHAIADIEASAKQAFGIGMGPFELMNVTGVPISLHAADSLGARLGPFYSAAALLAAQVARREIWPLGEGGEVRSDIVDRLLGVTYHIALTLVSEGVGCTEDVDIGARVGLRWRQGPFELMNQDGLPRVRALQGRVAERYDLPTPNLLQKTRSAFAVRKVAHWTAGALGYVMFNRPDQLNALDPEMMQELQAAFRQLDADPQVERIVLCGAGKAFVAGADLKFFLAHLQGQRIEPIVEFAAFGQGVFREIDRSPKIVVCRLDGMALGGGAELALACDVIVATAKGSLAFPETGIGIYPGLGGTQRLTKRVGRDLARFVLASGHTLQASDLADLGLAVVVEPGDLDAALGSAQPEPAKAPRGLLRDAAAIYAAGEASDSAAGKAVARIRHKAHNALRCVDDLTAFAERGDLDAGLAKETEGLRSLFTHANALEGIGALLERRRPTFVD
jgi:enoyl-CoA hydratase/3-hydroxyacyl-CoA dehydrogenase